ncbi:hypothetical protein CH371_14370 [Leptospira wolffii]|uniref:Uncharacterized protein n=1 Tax=Leptospira wolffii TaxID=409998 RepID=A0A2M9Z9M3_9LEPT|nr:hypothetical protein [Leptospira wolffii]PJZ65108.1 hypothetical protein CH371_14370 [Leptospira wolffii]
MNNCSRSFSVFVTRALILFLHCCISFNYGDVDSATKKVTDISTPKRSLGLVVQYEYFLNGTKKEVISNGRQEVRKQLTFQAYQDSDIFSKIEEGSQGDLNISVVIIEKAFVNRGLSMLTGISFGLFPSWGSSNLFVKTYVSDRNGKPIGEIVASSSSVTIMQIFLLAPMILFYPPYVYDEYIKGTNRYTLNEAVRRGIFRSD